MQKSVKKARFYSIVATIRTRQESRCLLWHSEDHLKDVQPTPTLLSFQCDQCNFIGASDKGLRQHTRMSHRISQLDGNNSDSDDSDIDSILEMVKCLQVLGTSKQCIAYCNYIFTTKEECYKHKFLSTSQCCQTIMSSPALTKVLRKWEYNK